MPKKLVLNNLREMGLPDVDIIIYYNNHYATTDRLSICEGLDDCISVFVDSKFIDESEIKDDLIEYYENKFKNNPQQAYQIVEDCLNNKNTLNI